LKLPKVLGQDSEIGTSEWEDRADRKVIVPATMREHIIFHGIHGKHISVVVCISAAGDRLTPFFLSSQTNSTVEPTLRINGFRMGIDLILRQKSKPDMNSELFNESVSAVPLPHITAL
jgi:hypothetical protein